MRDPRWLTALMVLACPLLAACGTTTTRSAAPSSRDVTIALRGSPAPLASLHHQADRLLPGGAGAFKARLRQLRGHPVVVNEWASWCDPCQSEFPVFQRVAVSYGREVAFLGIDGKDANGSARAFLRRFPVTYPSYVDPQASIARSLQADNGYPETLYFNVRGQMQFDHAGPYLSTRALKADIRHYLLQ